jgi:hypothetical protein
MDKRKGHKRVPAFFYGILCRIAVIQHLDPPYKPKPNKKEEDRHQARWAGFVQRLFNLVVLRRCE